MNLTSNRTDYPDICGSPSVRRLVGFSLFGGLMSMGVLLLPMYIYVFYRNRHREEKSNALTRQSYVTVMYITFSGVFYLIVKIIFLIYIDNATTKGIFARLFFPLLHSLVVFTSVFVMDVLVQVQHVLLILLSIQRFLIYFATSLEKYTAPSERVMNIIIHVIYALVVLQEGVTVVKDLLFGEQIRVYLDMIRLIYFISLNALFLLSALLYIPLYISIRKHRHLPSVIQAQPHKYAFYQTALTVVLKILSIPFFLYFTACSRLEMPDASTYIDSGMTPFIIQVTYLALNKRNFEMVMPSSLVQSFKSMCCPQFAMLQVEPAAMNSEQRSSQASEHS